MKLKSIALVLAAEQATFNADSFRSGMNQVASNASPGTVVTVTPRASSNGSNASVVCVKR